jgi:hypothetical protein
LEVTKPYILHYFSSFFKNNMNYSCEYEYNFDSGREQQLLFDITVTKLMELIRICYKTRAFLTCRVDIYKFFFSNLNNNLSLFL